MRSVFSKLFNPQVGLPEPLFLAVSCLTPLINVDLWIEDDNGEVLLTWRDDRFYGPGWHIPGGIIRFKEAALTRVEKVAWSELGVAVAVEPQPMAVQEIMSTERDIRGHFISLLYRCRLTTSLNPAQQAGQQPLAGQWRWHRQFPRDMIAQHACYQRFFDARS